MRESIGFILPEGGGLEGNVLQSPVQTHWPTDRPIVEGFTLIALGNLTDL